MSAKRWLIIWLVVVVSTLVFAGSIVYIVDPYFHYHKPDTESYYYELENERSQNDGIIRHFDYDALITGSSMTTNFKTSQMDRLFNCHSIKIPYSGGTFKEVNDAVEKALKNRPGLKTVVRSIDMAVIFSEWDAMRDDLGDYPEYLYDDNVFNDVEYVLNRDVLFGWVYKMLSRKKEKSSATGITSFDDYTNWQDLYDYGINVVQPDGFKEKDPADYTHLTEELKHTIQKNIELNVTNIADKYPNVDFYYFYPPYSMAFWYSTPDPQLQLEAEAYVTELIIPHKNIHLFSFNNLADIISDLNNYKDSKHYAEWISDYILDCMHEGKYRLTPENYKEYLKKEYDYITSFDYTSLNGQDDYDDDELAKVIFESNHPKITP